MMKIITISIFTIAIIILSGCAGSNNGELVGEKRSGYSDGKSPYGMVFVPQGSFTMGATTGDTTKQLVSQTKTVSVRSFWMDATEITNSEYRQFVDWVRDSIARKLLGEQFPKFLITKDKYGNELEPPLINWKTKLDWRKKEYADVLKSMYLPDDERIFHRKEIDSRKLIYEYQWVDMLQAAKKSNRYNLASGKYEGKVSRNGEKIKVHSRTDFIVRERVNVYPDTLCWISDFKYSINQAWTKKYFWHPGFSEYPVVGVNYKQAKAFTIWRTQLLNNYLHSKGKAEEMSYRLPTEAEWEYAARGGLKNAMYPWKGDSFLDKKGNYLANFKPAPGKYADDGGITTTPVASYVPNGYGIFDMAGNVAEWTTNSFDESEYSFTHDFNPAYGYDALPNDPSSMKRKVIRGGSWKDISYFLSCGARTYEYQDSARSYIGFRCVRDYIGDHNFTHQHHHRIHKKHRKASI